LEHGLLKSLNIDLKQAEKLFKTYLAFGVCIFKPVQGEAMRLEVIYYNLIDETLNFYFNVTPIPLEPTMKL
jgi:hypothetical protein